MFSKVKKLKDKIFSSPTGNVPGSKDQQKGSDSPTYERKEASKNSSFSSLSKRRDSLKNDNESSALEGRVGSTSTQAMKNGNPDSPKLVAVPPVHVSPQSSSSIKSQQQGPGLTPLNAMMGQSTGRRKSTPAELDMALRQPEGKAAIEELLGTNKKMVFGQYFSGQQNGAATPAVPDKPRAPKAAHMQAIPQQQGWLGAKGSFKPILEETPIKTITDDDAPRQPAVSKYKKPLAPIVVHEESEKSPSSEPPPQPLPSPVPTPKTTPKAHSPAQEGAPAKRVKVLSVSPQLPVHMAREEWNLAQFSILRKMYTGYASTVYQAMDKKSLLMVALKVYHMENLCELNHFQVLREIKLHSSLTHQNIISLYSAFQEGHNMVMVQEYAEAGDLYKLLHKNGGRLNERQAVEMVLHPFLCALHYLHTRGIMHRDIKPENVLFTEHLVLKLADFGLAINQNEERAVTRAGTLDYMAPEVLRCPPKNLPEENKNNASLHYNDSVDAWAVGVFAYELVVGFPPFAGQTQGDSVERIMNSVPVFPEKMSDSAKDFILRCLKKHPGDRPTVLEMLHHPWIRTYQRRVSMRIPVARRRSSVVNQRPNGLPAPSEGEEEAIEDLTPEQIEEMIQRLQVAKQSAIARDGAP